MEVLKTIILFFIFTLCAGCLDISEEYYLNHDGSGKVVRKLIFDPDDFNFGSKLKIGDPEVLKEKVLNIIDNTEGISAWSNVFYKWVDDKKIQFIGTAYFQDISKIKFYNGGGSLPISGHISFKEENDNWHLSISSSDKEKAFKPKIITEEQVSKKVSEFKAEVGKKYLLMLGIFETMQIKRKFHFSGELIKSTNFALDEQGVISNDFFGKKYIEFIEQNTSDDEWLKEKIRNGYDLMSGQGLEGELNAFLFGEASPVQATIRKSDSLLFDYTKEVENAKLEFNKILSELDGIEEIKKVEIPADKKGKFEIGGVRYVTTSNDDYDIRPFGKKPGYTLAIIGILPTQAIAIDEIKVNIATTNTGYDLLPEDEYARKINWPKLGEDGYTVKFDINLSLPNEKDQVLNEVSGELSYMASDEIKEIDFGFNSLEKGEKGKLYSATVLEVEEDKEISIKFNLNKNQVKSIKLLDKFNNEIKTTLAYSWSGNKTTYIFSSKNTSIPDDAKVIAEIFTNVKRYEIPFKLLNMSLLGNPL